MDTDRIHVFVYGTLLTGECNHRFLRCHELVQPARTAPMYELIDFGPFPCMVAGGETSVKGEVYAVDAETLALLDKLEGHPEFFVRSTITLEDGEEIQGYLMPHDKVVGCPRIDSGDWRQAVASSPRIVYTDDPTQWSAEYDEPDEEACGDGEELTDAFEQEEWPNTDGAGIDEEELGESFGQNEMPDTNGATAIDDEELGEVFGHESPGEVGTIDPKLD